MPYYRKRKGKNPIRVYTGILQPTDYADVEQLWREYYESQMKAAGNIASRRGQSAMSISEVDRKTFGIANAQGYDVEMILAALGSTGGKRSSQDAIDFASGLSPLAADVFGIPAGIPTQAKLTVTSDSITDAIDGIVKTFFFGGKVNPLAKKYGLSQKEFEQVQKLASAMGLDQAGLEQQVQRAAARKQKGKDIKFGLLDTQAELMASDTIRTQEEAALQEFMKAQGFAVGGAVKLYHGTTTGTNDSILKSFQEQGGMSGIAQGYGQGAGLFLYTDRDRAVKQAQMRVSGGGFGTVTSGDTSGRPMVVTFSEILDPKNFDLDYELEKGLIIKWLTSNYDQIKDKLNPTKDLGGIVDIITENRSQGIMSSGIVTKTASQGLKEIYAGSPSNITEGAIISQIISRLRTADPELVDAFESKLFEKPMGLVLKYIGESALRPISLEPFAKGGSAKDTVPALLTPGEFVINKQAAQKIGYSKLNKMNKADKIQGFNKGGAVGNIRRFFEGGKAEKDVERAQGEVIKDVSHALETVSEIISSLPAHIQQALKNTQIESLRPGQRLSLQGGSGPEFREGQRGVAVTSEAGSTAIGLKIGKGILSSIKGLFGIKTKDAATTETVAHETGHLADAAVSSQAGMNTFASETKGTFQFDVVEKVKPVMEKAFLNAGYSAEWIAKYLASNKELFAEFFAKASPAVRNILTSTIDSEQGMKMLAEELARTGSTYAGLQASDIVPQVGPGTPIPQVGAPGGTGGAPPPLPPRGGGGPPPLPPRGGGGPPPVPPGSSSSSSSSPAPPVDGIEQQRTRAERRAKRRNISYEDFIAESEAAALSGVASGSARAKEDRFEEFLGAGLSNEQEYRTMARSGDKSQEKKLTSTLKQDIGAATGLEGAALDQAVKDVIDKLKNTSQSFDTIIENNASIIEASKEVESAKSRAAKEYDKLVETLGKELTEEQFGSKKDFTRKAARAENRDIVSRQIGERFGKGGAEIAKFFPGMARKFNESGTANRLAEFGKMFETANVQKKLEGGLTSLFNKVGGGKLLDKIGFAGGTKGLAGIVGKQFGGLVNKLGGPATAAGMALSLVGDKLPDLYNSLDSTFGTKLGKSTAAAGVAGAIGGAGQGLATGATIGSIFGPPGAAVGAALGALVGAINGARDSIANKRLENTLDALKTTSGDLEKAFQKLEGSFTKADFDKVSQEFGKSLKVTSDLEGMATANTSWFNPLSYLPGATGSKQKAEAQEALRGKTQADVANIGRMASAQYRTMSDADFNKIYEQGIRGGETGASQADIAAAAESSFMVEEYKKQGRDASEAYLTSYRAEQARLGKSSSEIEKEISGNRAKAIEEGKKLVAEQQAQILKQIALARATKAVQIAAEALTQTFRKINAALQRFSDDMQNMDNVLQTEIGDLTGNVSMGKVNRTQEQVLGNISGYSTQEVQAAAATAARLAGGGEAGKRVEQSAVAAKVLQDELPDILRSTASGAGAEDIISRVEDTFSKMNISGDTAKPIIDELRKKLESEAESGTSFAEISSMDALRIAGDSAAQGLETAKNILKQFNDTLQKSIDYIDQQNNLIQQSLDYQRKANDIRLNGELQLARTLGKELSLDQMNAPENQTIRSMTSGIIPGGTLDPRQLGEAIRSNQATMAADEARLASLMAQGPESGEQADIDKYLRQVNDSTASLQKNKLAQAEATKALKLMADSGQAASNALEVMNRRAVATTAGANMLEKILTSDPEQLFDMQGQFAAAQKLAAGTATQEELQSTQFRQQGFAGLNELTGLLPESIRGKVKASAMRQSLQAGGTDLNQTLASYTDENGKLVKLSIEDVLRKMEKPEEDPTVKAYREAVDKQAAANEEMGKLFGAAADRLTQALNDNTAALSGDFQRRIQEAGPKQLEAEKKTAEATKPTTSTSDSPVGGAVKSAVDTTSQASTVYGLGTLPRDIRAGAAAGSRGDAFVSGVLNKGKKVSGAVRGAASGTVSKYAGIAKDMLSTARGSYAAEMSPFADEASAAFGKTGKVASKGGEYAAKTVKTVKGLFGGLKDVGLGAVRGAAQTPAAQQALKFGSDVVQTAKSSTVGKAATGLYDVAKGGLTGAVDAAKKTGAGKYVAGLVGKAKDAGGLGGLLSGTSKQGGKLLGSAGSMLSGVAKNPLVGTALKGASKILGPLGLVLGAGSAMAEKGEVKKDGKQRGMIEKGLLGMFTGGQDSSQQSMIGRMLGAKQGSTLDKAGAIGGAALSGAATGATIGSFIPVIGTAIGAGVGGLIGAGLEGYKQYTGGGKQKPSTTARSKAVEKQVKTAAVMGTTPTEPTTASAEKGLVEARTSLMESQQEQAATNQQIGPAQPTDNRAASLMAPYQEPLTGTLSPSSTPSPPATTTQPNGTDMARKRFEERAAYLRSWGMPTEPLPDNAPSTPASPGMEPDIFVRKRAEAEAQALQEEISRMESSISGKQSEISGFEKKAVYERRAKMGAGTYKKGVPTTSEAAAASAKADIETINAEMEEKRKQLKAAQDRASSAMRPVAKPVETSSTTTTNPEFAAFAADSAARRQQPASDMLTTIRQAQPTTALATQGPIPAPLGTTPVARTATASAGTQQGDTQQMMANVLTLDDQSRQFLESFGTILNNFGTYVDKLATINIPKIPEKIEMQGNHVVDVRITGAAAFEGLKKDFGNMIQAEISKKMNKIWVQSNGQYGEAEGQKT